MGQYFCRRKRYHGADQQQGQESTLWRQTPATQLEVVREHAKEESSSAEYDHEPEYPTDAGEKREAPTAPNRQAPEFDANSREVLALFGEKLEESVSCYCDEDDIAPEDYINTSPGEQQSVIGEQLDEICERQSEQPDEQQSEQPDEQQSEQLDEQQSEQPDEQQSEQPDQRQSEIDASPAQPQIKNSAGFGPVQTDSPTYERNSPACVDHSVRKRVGKSLNTDRGQQVSVDIETMVAQISKSHSRNWLYFGAESSDDDALPQPRGGLKGSTFLRK